MSGARFLLASVVAVLLVPAVANADDKLTCIAQLDRAQSLQSARKLSEARASYLECAAATCPDLVRDDCSRSAVDMERSLPSLVFSARDAASHDLPDVRVLLDGEAVGAALDGHAVIVNPGAHTVRMERIGGGVVETKLVAREGEKNRLVSGSFVTPITNPNDKPKAESGRFPTLPVVLGGAGLLAIGSGVFLRLDASSDAGALHGTCAPACDQSARDALSDKLVAANIALGVGIAAVVLATATWLVSSRH